MSCIELTLMLKCGLLVGDQQVRDFKFISWCYGQQKPYIRQQSKGVITQTLREKLKTIFPEIVEPFQVIFIDKDGDKIVLPVDDIKETVTALQCFGFYLSNTPIQIFVQTQDLKKLTKASSKLEDRSAKICGCGDCGLIIADKLSQLESTIHILGQRIVVLLEDLALDSKRSEKDAKSAETFTSHQAIHDAMGPHDPIKPVESMLNTQSYEIGDSPRVRSRTSSSSSFSVQSRSDNSGEREEGWTRVNEMNGGGTRRRRFITESSCASHRSDHSQDGIMRSMEDEMHSLIADSPDTMSRSP